METRETTPAAESPKIAGCSNPRDPGSRITALQIFAALSAAASALAAGGSFWVARTNMTLVRDGQKRQFQPYVEVLSSTLRTAAGDVPTVRIVFENTGLTPARHLKIECYTVAASGRSVDDSAFPLKATMAAESGILASHHQGSCAPGVSRVSGQALMASLSNGTQALGARAYLSYDDDFGQHHELVFTGMMGGKFGVAPDGRMIVTGRNGEDIRP